MTIAGLALGERSNRCEEGGMNGYQITFFTHQDRRHKGKPMGEWLLGLVNELGLRGASLHSGGESFSRGGRITQRIFLNFPISPSRFLSP